MSETVVTPSPSTSSASTARPTRPLWLRLIAAQETGLIAVIFLMVTGLFLATPSIDQRTNEALVGTAAAPVVATDSADGFTVTVPGKAPVKYLEADGYEYRPIDNGVMLVRSMKANKFLNPANILSILTAASFIAIMAVGMTGIIVSGGIDLSVGSVYALSAVLGAFVLRGLIGTSSEPVLGASPALGILVAIVACCGVGAACGALNGVATVGLKVHPFIITLGGMAVYRGIAFVSTKGLTVGPFPSDFIASFGKVEVAGIYPIPMLMMFAMAAIGWFVLSRTVFGRRVYAVGGNETAAKYAGVPVGATKIWLFTLSGLLAGLSAALLLGYYGAAGSDAGKGYELNVIAAAVVGGASLSGGRGTAIGAVLGAIVIQLIDNSILILGIDQNYKEIVIGLAIVLAVVVDQTKHRLLAGGRKH